MANPDRIGGGSCQGKVIQIRVPIRSDRRSTNFDADLTALDRSTRTVESTFQGVPSPNSPPYIYYLGITSINPIFKSFAKSQFRALCTRPNILKPLLDKTFQPRFFGTFQKLLMAHLLKPLSLGSFRDCVSRINNFQLI